MVKCNAIQEMWIKQIKKDYNDSKRINITFPIKHDPPHYSNGKPILNEFYLKPVITFIPHRNYPGIQLQCPCCNNVLYHKGWSSNPAARYIHDMKCGVYLVQFVYECHNNICKDYANKNIPIEILLESLPAYVRSQFPVYLTNSSGMTKDYLLYITSDAITGKSMFEIGTLIATMRTNHYLEKRVTYTSARDTYNKLISRSVVREDPVTDSFSNFDDANGYNECEQQDRDTIVEVFKNYVKQHSPYFQACMDNMPVPESLSIDSTFNIRKRTKEKKGESRNYEGVKTNGASFIMGGIVYYIYAYNISIIVYRS